MPRHETKNFLSGSNPTSRNALASIYTIEKVSLKEVESDSEKATILATSITVS